MAAFTTNTITVTTTPVALFTAGPVSVTVINTGSGTVYLGTSGAGNQKFPLTSGEKQTFSIANTEVIYAVSVSGTNQVSIASI